MSSENFDCITNEGVLFQVAKVSLSQQKKSEKTESYFVKVDFQNGRLQFKSFSKKIEILSTLSFLTLNFLLFNL
jgi:hypothetical protein